MEMPLQVGSQAVNLSVIIIWSRPSEKLHVTIRKQQSGGWDLLCTSDILAVLRPVISSNISKIEAIPILMRYY
jgi:hypothetical protein